MFSFPLRNDQIKKGGARPPFSLFKVAVSEPCGFYRILRMLQNDIVYDAVLRSLSANYFTCFAKESFKSTVRLNTRWPGLESSLSRQK